MRILAFDTAGTHGGLAVVDDGIALGAVELDPPGSYAEQILVALDRLLKELSLSPADIDLVAVNVGPGSFTGVRIGISTAQGFAFGLGRPLVGVSSLELLAAWAGRVTENGGSFHAGLIDARRGEVYYAAYRLRTEVDAIPVVPAGAAAPENIREALGPVLASPELASPGAAPLVICGDGVPVVAAELARWPERVMTVFPPRGVDAATLLARLALSRFEREGAPAIIEAIYIRPADARKPVALK